MAATRTDSQIQRALLEHLRGLVTSPSMTIAYPDVKFSRPQGTSPSAPLPYLEASIFLAPTESFGIGDDSANEISGFLQVDVVYPENAGAIEPAEVAAQVISHFKRGTLLTEGSTKVKIDRPPYKMTPVKDPPYTRTPVTIRWQVFAPQT